MRRSLHLVIVLWLATALAAHATPVVTEITNFTKNDTQAGTYSGWTGNIPIGQFTAPTTWATPFDISANTSGNTVFTPTINSTYTVNIGIANVTTVYTMLQGYNLGALTSSAGSIEFFGSAGATETFALTGEYNIRGLNPGTASALDASVAQNVWTSSSGSLLDEQMFALSSAFATQTLTDFVVTSNSVSYNVLSGVTVNSLPLPESSLPACLALLAVASMGALVRAR